LRIWSEFYSPGYVFPSYEEVMTMRATTSPQEFAKSFHSLSVTAAASGASGAGSGHGNDTLYLNNLIYKERMKRVIQPFLQEANQRVLEEMVKQQKWSELLGTCPSFQVMGHLFRFPSLSPSFSSSHSIPGHTHQSLCSTCRTWLRCLANSFESS
jgi:hypothetical protein